MSGHSKWSTIKHGKAVTDARRSALFTKLAKEVIIAARQGGGSPDSNFRLRMAVQRAKASNMPGDSIDRAIKRGAGEDDGQDRLEEVTYEGYGPGGVAVIVEALTDNRNRTASEVRSAFVKHGGNLAETGAVSFMFEHVGLINYAIYAGDADTVFEAALEAGADDVESGEGGHDIYCAPDDFAAVRDSLEAALGTPAQARLDWRSQNTVEVDEKQAETLLKMLDSLEDSDDVQRVAANFEISDEIMARLSA